MTYMFYDSPVHWLTINLASPTGVLHSLLTVRPASECVEVCWKQDT